MNKETKSGVQLIAEERNTHVSRGYNNSHDDTHTTGELADMAAIYACTHREDEVRDLTLRQFIWGTHPSHIYEHANRSELDWLTEQPDRVTELVKAGALIAAEVDRLNKYTESASTIQAEDVLYKFTQIETSNGGDAFRSDDVLAAMQSYCQPLEQEVEKLKQQAVEGLNLYNNQTATIVRLQQEVERLKGLIEDDLKRQVRLNMPGTSEHEQEKAWQAYKRQHNL